MHFCDLAKLTLSRKLRPSWRKLKGKFFKTKRLFHDFVSWWRLGYFTAQLIQTIRFIFSGRKDYLMTFPLKCVVTLTQPFYHPIKHWHCSSSYWRSLKFKIGWGWVRLSEVEHDIMNYQCRGLRLRQITQIRGLIIHYIMRKPIQ